MKNNGGPAFPGEVILGYHYVNNVSNVPETEPTSGMSLRDYFAGKAVQGELMAQGDDTGYWVDFDKLAIRAYNIADAMLKVREL